MIAYSLRINCFLFLKIVFRSDSDAVYFSSRLFSIQLNKNSKLVLSQMSNELELFQLILYITYC